MTQIVPQLFNPTCAQHRYSDTNSKRQSVSKLGVKPDSLINYELLGLSNSKNFMADRRKKGKSSFFNNNHKKVYDLSFSNNSSALLSQHKMPTSTNTQ